MGKFKGVSSAKVSAGGVYFLAGLYGVKVKRVHMITSRKKEDLFIVECVILTSNNDLRKPGTTCSWVVKMSQDAALGNIKGFMAAINGIDPNDDGAIEEQIGDDLEELCETAVSDDNPLEDENIDLEVVNIKTREGNDFSLHKWKPAGSIGLE